MPETLTFQTKAAIGLDLIDQANTWGVRHASVVADAGYGDDPWFLNGLETRGEHYVVAVRANFSVVLSRPPARRLFPLGRIAAAHRWRRSIAR